MAKLTLSVDAGIVKEAKKYADERQTTVSRIVSNLFSSLTSSPKPTTSPRIRGPLTRRLVGMASKAGAETRPAKELLADALAAKHLGR